MISRIPYDNLARILNKEETGLFDDLYDEYISSFKEEDYTKGYYLFIQNSNFKKRLGHDRYRILALSYYIYMCDMRRIGHSLLFDGVDSIDELISNFKKFSKK